MTEKSKKRHDEALNQIHKSVLDREWMWDKKLLNAIKTVVYLTTESHTIQSRSRSLLSLIRTHVDPALSQWMEEKKLGMRWQFSKIVRLEYGLGYSYLKAFGMQGHANDWFASDQTSTMADLLIYFLNFCASHTSETVKKIYLDPKRRQSQSESPERIGKGLKNGARASGKQMKVSVHLIGRRDWLLQLGLCQVCGDATAARIEFEVVTDGASKVDASIKKDIAKGVEFSSKTKGSNYFCPAHSERDAGSGAYKKGRAQAELFSSLLLALTFSGVGLHLNELFPLEWDVPFAKEAVRSSACQHDLELIAERMRELGGSALGKSDSDRAKDDVVQAIFRMFHKHLALTPMSVSIGPS